MSELVKHSMYLGDGKPNHQWFTVLIIKSKWKYRSRVLCWMGISILRPLLCLEYVLVIDCCMLIVCMSVNLLFNGSFISRFPT